MHDACALLGSKGCDQIWPHPFVTHSCLFPLYVQVHTRQYTGAYSTGTYISRVLSIFSGEMRGHSTITVTHWDPSHRHKYSAYGNDCPLTCMVLCEAFSIHEHSWQSYNKQWRASQRSDLSRRHTGDMFTLNPQRVHLATQG